MSISGLKFIFWKFTRFESKQLSNLQDFKYHKKIYFKINPETVLIPSINDIHDDHKIIFKQQSFNEKQ